MNARDAEILNRRARMTPEERDADIVAEMFGPFFAQMFPSLPAPKAPAVDEEDAP